MKALSLFSRLRPDQQPTRTESPEFNGDVENKDGHASQVKSTEVDSSEHAGDNGLVERIDENAQHGVQKIEATTSVWSKQHLYIAYILIFLIYFVDSMQQQMGFSFTPYVTSSFALHSLTATTGVMSSLIGGLVQLPLAKILDIWGRPQGFALMVCFLTVGLVMMAACDNVETYAAAQVFYWVGGNGMGYALSVFIADTSHLKNRALMFAYSNSPYIATTWIGGPLATSFLKGAGWRWGYGTFAIVMPAVTAPLFFLFLWNLRKAKEAGIMPVRKSSRTTRQSIWHYIVEFDCLGILLLAAAMALFLLPFNIYSYQAKEWADPMIICMLVFGVVLAIAFVIYEARFAPVTFIPYSLLTDRTVLGASLMYIFVFFSWYIWDSYFPSLLQVVFNLSITRASYVTNIYSIGACFWSLIVGLLVRWSGRFKWLNLYFGIPVTILGVGLMIHFRQPTSDIGYVVMCQIFIAFAGGTLVITSQVAAMAAASHQHVAVVLAFLGLFSSIGGAIGQTVAAAIWTGLMPAALERNLPASALPEAANIYSSLTIQLSYPWGSPERDAINQSYGECQRIMLIIATCALVPAWVCVAIWRDIKVKDFKQVKGTVI